MTQRHDVESWWPVGNPVGVDNVVHNNCVWGGRQGTIDTSDGGLRASDNLTINPQYVSTKSHNYEMSTNSPCLALVGNIQAAVDGTTPVVAAPVARDATKRALMRARRHSRRRRHHHRHRAVAH